MSLLFLGNEARAIVVVAVTRHDIVVDRLLLHQRLIIIPDVQLFGASASRLVQLSRSTRAVGHQVMMLRWWKVQVATRRRADGLVGRMYSIEELWEVCVRRRENVVMGLFVVRLTRRRWLMRCCAIRTVHRCATLDQSRCTARRVFARKLVGAVVKLLLLDVNCVLVTVVVDGGGRRSGLQVTAAIKFSWRQRSIAHYRRQRLLVDVAARLCLVEWIRRSILLMLRVLLESIVAVRELTDIGRARRWGGMINGHAVGNVLQATWHDWVGIVWLGHHLHTSAFWFGLEGRRNNVKDG